MARITKPNEQVQQTRGGISMSAAAAVGEADMAFGQQVARIGEQYFLEAKAADQTAKYSKAYTDAMLQFNQGVNERMQRVTDENGNPTYDTLSKDIGELGKEVMEAHGANIQDPEVAAKFRNAFGSLVANRQVSGMAQARSQQQAFAQESVIRSIEAIGETAAQSEVNEFDLYTRQSDQILDSAVASGAISPQQRTKIAEDFRSKVTATRSRALIAQDPQAAKEMFSDPDQARKFGLRENERLSALASAERAVTAIERAQEAEMKKLEKRYKESMNGVNTLIEQGIEPNPQILDDLVSATKGTALEGQVQALLTKKRITQEFAGMSPNARGLAIAEMKRDANNVEQLELIKSLERMNKNMASAQRDDIVTYAAQQGVVNDLEPIDFSSDVTQQLQNRRDVMDQIEVHYGKQNSGLTKVEISTFREKLTQGSVQQQAALLGQIVTGYGEKSLEVFDDLAKTGAVQQAFAGSLIQEGNPEAARLILTGLDLKKNKNIPLPSSNEFNAANQDLMPTYTDPGMRGEIAKAANSVYAAMAAEAGDFSGEFNPDLYEKAIEQVTNGGSITVGGGLFGGGSKIEPPRKGIDADEFEDWMKNLTDADIQEMGGFQHMDEGAAAALQDYQLTTAGRGQYHVSAIVDGELIPVLDKSGNPFVLDYETAQQPATEGTGINVVTESAQRQVTTFLEGVREVGGFPQPGKQFKREAIMPGFHEKISGVVSSRATPETLEVLENAKPILAEFGIDSPKRIRHFMAQISHESGGFRHMNEQRSDASAEAKYGKGTRVGRILGNTQPGDGAKYKGRGYIQLTGRSNYEQMSAATGYDLVNNPELAARPDIALRIAAAFWKSRGLSRLADGDNLREITRRINGGYNGLRDRQLRFDRLKGLEQ